MRRWIKAIVLVGLLAGGGLLVFRRAPLPVTVTLSDGSVFEVAKITTGPVHRFHYRYDDRWQDYVGQFIPKSLLAKFPLTLRANLTPHVVDYTITNAGAIVWTTSHDPTFSRSSGRLEVAVADQHGVEVRRASGTQRLISFSGASPGITTFLGATMLPGATQTRITLLGSTNSVVFTSAGGGSITSTIATLGLTNSTGVYFASSVSWGVTPGSPPIVTAPTATMSPRATSFSLNAWPIASLPRHSREITLGFYLDGERAGEIRIPNSVYHPTSFHPEHLPQMKSIGDARIRLLTVEARPRSDYVRSVDWTVQAEVVHNDKALTDWQFDSVQLLDDTGPLTWLPQLWWPLFDPKSRRQPALQFRGVWPDTAWKLRLWAFQRTGFASNEIWTIKDVPVNHAGAWKVERQESRQLDGMTVELLGFLGPQTPGHLEVRRSQVNVCFAAPPRTEGVRIIFSRGWDDQNRPLESEGAVYLNAGVNFPESVPQWARGQQPAPSYSFGFDPAPDAKTLTLEFAVTRTRFADFIVQPTGSEPGGVTNSPAK